MKLLKQSTSTVLSFGPFVNPSDGVTLVTTLVSAIDHVTTGIFLSKNGGAGAVRHASVTASTYDAYGMYLVTLDTTDTNTLGRLRVMFAAAASCLPVWDDCLVVPANIFDSLVSGSDVLDVSAIQILGGAIPAPNTTGVPLVDTKYVGGTLQTAGDIPARLPAALVGGRMDSSIGAIVNGVIAAASFATGALDAVWSTAARLLTAGTNIILAKGVGVTGFTDIDGAGVRTAVGLGTANLDTQLATIQADTDDLQTRVPAALVGGRMDSSVGAMAADTLTASALAADAVDEILDDPIGDGTLTVRESLRVNVAVLAGKLSGASAPSSTITIRNVADSKDVVVATTDDDGNRTATVVTP